MSKRLAHAASAVLSFAFTLGLSEQAVAADLFACKKACGVAYGQCVQANPDPDVFEKICTPKRNQCAAVCEGQASKAKTALPEYATRKLPPPSKTTKLFWEAFEQRNYEMMDLLLQQGADVNCENCSSYNYTPLIDAVSNMSSPSSIKRVDYVLSRGADVNYQNRQGISALMAASTQIREAGYSGGLSNLAPIEAINLLLANGADVTLKDANGDAALHRLAVSGIGYGGKAYKYWLQALNSYIERGAEINLKNRKGQTPLMLVSAECEPQAVADLLAAGADLSPKNMSGDTALAIAIEKASRHSDKSCNEAVSLLSSPPSALVKNDVTKNDGAQQSGTKGLMDSLKRLDDSIKGLNN